MDGGGFNCNVLNNLFVVVIKRIIKYKSKGLGDEGTLQNRVGEGNRRTSCEG